MLLSAIAYASAKASERYAFSEKHMGVDFRIVVYSSSSETAENAARLAFEKISRLDEILSDYKDDSELSRLSKRSGSGKTVPLSKDLWRVLSASRKLSEQTSGVFDITVGPLARRWRVARFYKKLPSNEKLRSALKSVGYKKLELYPGSRSAKLSEPNMSLDLGGIAKGYAVDQALATLRTNGANVALVDGGGDLAMGDAPPERSGWRIEVGGRKHPELPTLNLQNLAVATSGDIEQFVEIADKHYSHLIDPRTGIGLTNRLQVTVIAPTGIQADSLASALSVLGPREASSLLKSYPKAQAYFLQGSGKNRSLLKLGKR